MATSRKSTAYRSTPSGEGSALPLMWHSLTRLIVSMGAPFVVARLVALPSCHDCGLPPQKLLPVGPWPALPAVRSCDTSECFDGTAAAGAFLHGNSDASRRYSMRVSAITR